MLFSMFFLPTCKVSKHRQRSAGTVLLFLHQLDRLETMFNFFNKYTSQRRATLTNFVNKVKFLCGENKIRNPLNRTKKGRNGGNYRNKANLLSAKLSRLVQVVRIRDILVRIRIRVTVPVTNGY
jgi:hypothetical protein